MPQPSSLSLSSLTINWDAAVTIERLTGSKILEDKIEVTMKTPYVRELEALENGKSIILSHFVTKF